MADLLPSNSMPLERAIAAAARHDAALRIRTLYNPATCPVEVLPFLAWAWSVDRWDDTWPEATKRAACANSFYVHKRKGTIAAIRSVVEPFGYLLRVVEWWQLEPNGVPGTFALEIGVQNTGITELMYEELTLLIDDAKPVSRQMIGLDISLETSVPAYQAVPVMDGDILEVYPWEPMDIDVHVGGYNLLTDHTQDLLDVYLNG